MKTWFVYLINGKKIGTWANNPDDAKGNLIAEFGDVPMEFLGIEMCGIGAEPEEIICRGMSPVDKMIAFGLSYLLVGLRFNY